MVIRKTTDDTLANRNGMMGLSGMDTASMLKQIMAPYKQPIALTTQKQQVVLWKQERYREVITKLSDFSSKYLDYMKPATCVLTSGTFRKMSVSNPGEEYVKITSTATTDPGSHTVEVKEMPTFSKIVGRLSTSKDLVGQTAPDWTAAAAAGEALSINMDGIRRSIAITSDIDSAAKLQEAVDATFGANKISVTEGTSGELHFTEVSNSGVNQIIIYDGTNASASYNLGFGSGGSFSNRVTMDSTLDTLANQFSTPLQFRTVESGTYDPQTGNPILHRVVQFSINGRDFEFDSKTSLRTVIDTVNNDAVARAKISYDAENDRFTMEATVAGPGANLAVTEHNTTFFNALGIGGGDNLYAGSTDVTADLLLGSADPSAVYAAVNSAMTGPNGSYKIVLNVDGVAKTITLDNSTPPGAAGTIYSDTAALVADINAKLTAAFPNSGLSFASAPTSDPLIWDFYIQVDRTPPANSDDPVAFPTNISIGAPPGMSDGDATQMFRDLGLTEVPKYTEGTFGKVVIDGTTVAVDRTSFEYEGLYYELKKVTPAGDPVEFSMEQDTDSVVEVIREFVDAYNEMIGLVSGILTEERDNDYTPLTDEQREAMEDEDIEKWEVKAKEGLLRGDINLIGFEQKMRRTIFGFVYDNMESESSIGVTLESIGIFTNKYEELGKLRLNEETFKKALESDLTGVVNLFTKAQETPDKDDTKSKQWNALQERKYLEKTGGIAWRMQAVLSDYVRTTHDTSNNKGIMVMYAGVVDDTSDLDNSLSREILRYDDKIQDLWDRYDRIEAKQLAIMSRLESFIQSSNAQSAWLSQQMGGA